MSQQMKQIAARILECEPQEIMMVTPHTTYVNVIFNDFRKEKITQEEFQLAANIPDPIAENDEAPDDLVESAVQQLLNDTYLKILAQPHMHDRELLRQLAAQLRIPNAATLNKKPLVKAINKWKAEHGN